MLQNEQDSQDRKKQKFQPFLFINCTIIIMLVFLAITFLVTKPRRIIHTFKRLKLQVSHISLQNAQKPPWKTFLVKQGDNLQNIFARANIDNNTLYQIYNNKNAQPFLMNLLPKQAFYMLFDKNHKLCKMILRINKLKYLQIIKQQDDWQSELVLLPLEKKIKTTSGFIDQTFQQSIKKCGVSTNVCANFANIFGSHIDFARQIHQGDEFKLIYEAYYDGDKKIKSGKILAAELILNHHPFYAIGYNNNQKALGYYRPNGKNWHLAFMRTPVHYKRVSSPFGARRRHPILHIVRPHQGVDLAAARGTPIKAASDGRIIYRGRKGGYGEAIIIKHNRKYTTLYAHMSRFAPHLHVGSRVKEGQVIGFVGATGLATGPHLHYEFRIYGIPHDPMKVKLPDALSIAKKQRKNYLEYAHKMVKKLTSIKS